MATRESLYDLLSVTWYLHDRITAEVIDLPFEPVRPNTDRMTRIGHEMRALVEAVLAAHPSLARNPDEPLPALSAADRAFATCLLEAQRLEHDRKIPEALAVYEQFLRGDPSTDRRAMVADQIARLLNLPDDDAIDLRPSQADILHIGALSVAELEQIDQSLFESVGPRFQKLAFIVAGTLIKFRELLLPDVFYAQRVIRMVRLGQLESQGDLRRMGRSEVRKPRAPVPLPR